MTHVEGSRGFRAAPVGPNELAALAGAGRAIPRAAAGFERDDPCRSCRIHSPSLRMRPGSDLAREGSTFFVARQDTIIGDAKQAAAMQYKQRLVKQMGNITVRRLVQNGPPAASGCSPPRAASGASRAEQNRRRTRDWGEDRIRVPQAKPGEIFLMFGRHPSRHGSGAMVGLFARLPPGLEEMSRA